MLVQEENGAPQSPVNPLSDLYAVLEGSALIPFLESKLQANSFLEIGRHTSVYRMVIGIIRELCLQSSLVSLLGPLPDQTASIHSLLQNLETQARIMISRIGRFDFIRGIVLGPKIALLFFSAVPDSGWIHNVFRPILDKKNHKLKFFLNDKFKFITRSLFKDYHVLRKASKPPERASWSSKTEYKI
jgi:hypothetical protein